MVYILFCRNTVHRIQATHIQVWPVSLSVVENLNIFCDLSDCLFSCCIALMINKFILQCSPEALHGGIIITVSFPAHGSFHVEPFKKSCVVLRAVLASPVRMIDETRLRLFSFHRHQKGCDDEVFGNSRSQGIAYNLSVKRSIWAAQ